jgi:hypothetical protein
MFGDASVALPSNRKRPNHWPNWILINSGAFLDEYYKWSRDPKTYTLPPNPEFAQKP